MKDAFFSPLNPLAGVYVAGHGVSVTVTSQATGGTMTVTSPTRGSSLTRSATVWARLLGGGPTRVGSAYPPRGLPVQ